MLNRETDRKVMHPSARHRCLVHAQFKLAGVPHFFCALCRKGAGLDSTLTPLTAAHSGVIVIAYFPNVSKNPNGVKSDSTHRTASLAQVVFSDRPKARSYRQTTWQLESEIWSTDPRQLRLRRPEMPASSRPTFRVPLAE